MKTPLSYLTIARYGETEIIIQKSRFICQATPVKTEEEAQKFIADISKKYWDASHNCSAYLVTDLIQKASDDGEPSGTAGKPMLEVLHSKKVQYTAVVITRYFGGIKLGAGGLVRAYSQGTSAALEAAGIVQPVLHQSINISFDYTHIGKLEHELRQTSYFLDQPIFTEHVSWTLWVPVDEIEQIQSQIIDWTHGQANVELGELEYRVK
ncbi:uncharacterized protein, YigZ family [Thermoactinomyces sp. DSM 45891]|uniref:YigZ family protein n=1 Tax=Thermoactinomyces sp. DSM 45891 TaxID=1761907 RepID=UPI0009239E9F|nr:YigZ family protein [Thermoactinomyces sp. DSM 45891]SFX23281.1 uncharacterized protein, YigZ family [Thermoactinomyces sp. DSM 45891]